MMESLKYRALKLVGHNDYRRFIVLSRSRVGSYLLISFLNSHPNVRSDGEILHRLNGRLAVDIVDAAFRKEPRSVRAKGFKVFYYHPNDDKETKILEYLANMDGLHVLHLKRRNILRTLVSRKIAGSQGVWKTKAAQSAGAPPRKEVSFTLDELERRFARTRAWERWGDELFRDHPMLALHYEDLVADTERVFKGVTEFLGVAYVKPRTSLVRQNPEGLRHLISNYAELEAAFRGTEWESFFDDDATG
jgi:LPS sulfotransferase NodH